MYAVVLAGGRGTRLYPVVQDRPKPMAPVGNKCFLEIVVAMMKQNGLTEFIFCVCHMAEKIIDYFGDGGKFGVKISYSVESEPLGTGGAIGLLRNVIDDAFCVLNGDTYQELDVRRLIAQHRTKGGIATMTLVKTDNASRYGQVVTDQDGYVIKFGEKDPGRLLDGEHGPDGLSGLINAGIYVWEPAVFKYIPPRQFSSLEKDILPAVLKANEKIYTYSCVQNFIDIGIPSDYARFVRRETGSRADREPSPRPICTTGDLDG